MATRENHISVRGISLHQEACQQVSVGDLVMFEPEPANHHDPNAIAVLVMVGGGLVKVGYVPRELTAGLGRHVLAMKSGDDEYGYWNAHVSKADVIKDHGDHLNGMTGVNVIFSANEYIPKQQSVSRR